MSFAATIVHPALLYPIDEPPPQANVDMTETPFCGTLARSVRFHAQSGFRGEFKSALGTLALKVEFVAVNFFGAAFVFFVATIGYPLQ